MQRNYVKIKDKSENITFESIIRILPDHFLKIVANPNFLLSDQWHQTKDDNLFAKALRLRQDARKKDQELYDTISDKIKVCFYKKTKTFIYLIQKNELISHLEKGVITAYHLHFYTDMSDVEKSLLTQSPTVFIMNNDLITYYQYKNIRDHIHDYVITDILVNQKQLLDNQEWRRITIAGLRHYAIVVDKNNFQQVIYEIKSTLSYTPHPILKYAIVDNVHLVLLRENDFFKYRAIIQPGAPEVTRNVQDDFIDDDNMLIDEYFQRRGTMPNQASAQDNQSSSTPLILSSTNTPVQVFTEDVYEEAVKFFNDEMEASLQTHEPITPQESFMPQLHDPITVQESFMSQINELTASQQPSSEVTHQPRCKFFVNFENIKAYLPEAILKIMLGPPFFLVRINAWYETPCGQYYVSIKRDSNRSYPIDILNFIEKNIKLDDTIYISNHNGITVYCLDASVFQESQIFKQRLFARLVSARDRHSETAATKPHISNFAIVENNDVNMTEEPELDSQELSEANQLIESWQMQRTNFFSPTFFLQQQEPWRSELSRLHAPQNEEDLNLFDFPEDEVDDLSELAFTPFTPL